MAEVRDDWLAQAFGRFQAEVHQETRPPAAHTVRRMVRRRHGIWTAAAVAAVLVGAVVALIATAQRPPRYPPLTAAQLRDLQGQAYQILEQVGLSGGLPITITAGTRTHTYSLDHLGSSPMRFAKGLDYDLLAQCMGRGTVIMDWQAPGGLAGRTTVVCGGATFQMHFVPQVDVNAIQIHLTPDAEAIGRAVIVVGFAEYQ